MWKSNKWSEAIDWQAEKMKQILLTAKWTIYLINFIQCQWTINPKFYAWRYHFKLLTLPLDIFSLKIVGSEHVPGNPLINKKDWKRNVRLNYLRFEHTFSVNINMHAIVLNILNTKLLKWFRLYSNCQFTWMSELLNSWFIFQNI